MKHEHPHASEMEHRWDTDAVIALIKQYLLQDSQWQKATLSAPQLATSTAGVPIRARVAIRDALLAAGVGAARYLPTRAYRPQPPDEALSTEPLSLLICLPLAFRHFPLVAHEIVSAITQDNTQPPKITMVTCATTATTFSEGDAQVTQLMHTVQENGTEVAVIPALHSAESALTRYTSQFWSRHRLVLHLCTGRNTADLGTPEPLAPGTQLSADHEGTLQLFYAPLSGELGIIKS